MSETLVTEGTWGMAMVKAAWELDVSIVKTVPFLVGAIVGTAAVPPDELLLPAALK